jgi:hypothetical protein
MLDKQPDMQIPHLKRDALIRLELGTGWIGRFQEGYMYLLQGHEEDIKKLEERQGKQEDLTGWEQMVIASSMLLQEIMTIAQKSDQLELKPIESLIPSNLTQDLGQPE